jgi:hypothetical protein
MPGMRRSVRWLRIEGSCAGTSTPSASGDLRCRRGSWSSRNSSRPMSSRSDISCDSKLDCEIRQAGDPGDRAMPQIPLKNDRSLLPLVECQEIYSWGIKAESVCLAMSVCIGEHNRTAWAF